MCKRPKSPIVVKKFGGTSVGGVERIQKVAQLIQESKQWGEQPLVVVSAMAGVTNQLASWAEACAGQHTPLESEWDAVLTTGEQVAAGLAALALQSLGLKARSFFGWQLPIITDQGHGDADILSIRVDELQQYMMEGGVPVVAGFQGITPQGRIASLGRGGSDTTAVALAALLEARLCQIFTDVDGVYDADPACVKQAKKIDTISYEAMASFSQHGSNVLHPKALNWAKQYRIPLQVLSTFQPQNPGTFVGNRVQKPARGVAHKGVLRWRIPGLSRKRADHLFQAMALRKIHLWGWQWSAAVLTFFTEPSSTYVVRQNIVPAFSITPQVMLTLIGIPFEELSQEVHNSLQRMGVEHIFRSSGGLSFVVKESQAMPVLNALHRMVQER